MCVCDYSVLVCVCVSGQETSVREQKRDRDIKETLIVCPNRDYFVSLSVRTEAVKANTS